MPRLFDPYTLKDVTLRNRIIVSPMCQYMARDREVNEWHRAHYASLARGGAGLVIIEAAAVSPEGRITWADVGLWNDQQAEALRPIVADIENAGSAPGIQIAHGGERPPPIALGREMTSSLSASRTLGRRWHHPLCHSDPMGPAFPQR